MPTDPTSSPVDLGHSDCMGPRLRALVEAQLVEDLNHYLPDHLKLSPDAAVFDWSDSCVEGHRISFLDGEVENFSGIAVKDDSGKLIAGGWMDMVHAARPADWIRCYWVYLDLFADGRRRVKADRHIPVHVWDGLDAETQALWMRSAPKVPKRLP